MTMSVNVMGGREDAWDATITKVDQLVVDSSDTRFNPDSKKKEKQKRSWKKPKDKPMRPLSAYNMFFQNQRERIVAGNSEDPTPEEIEESVTKLLKSKNRGPKKRQDRKSHGQISFGDLARTIAAKWKVIDPNIKEIYNKYAGQEKIRYKKEVVVWKEKKENEHDAMSRQNSLLNSSTSLTDSVRSLTSCSPSLSASLTSSFNPSDSINSTHCSSRITQDDVIQRQQDILRQQMGFVDRKPHFRVDRYGSDNVIKEVPDVDLDRNTKPQSFQLNAIAGDNDGHRKMSADSANGNFSQASSDVMFEKLQDLQQGSEQFSQQQQQQPLLQDHQQQILMRLQEQQMQQLRELQKARDESSRMSNISTTNMTALLNQMLPQRSSNTDPQHSHSVQQIQTGNGTEAQRQWMSTMEQSEREQFRQLEEVTRKLDSLKQQQRRMNQLMKDCCEMDDLMFADDGGHSTIQNTSNNRENFSADFVSSQQHANFDRNFGERQRMYNSFSDMNNDGSSILGNQNSGTNTFEHAGGDSRGFEQKQGDQRNNQFLRTETNNNVGIDDFQSSAMPNQQFNNHRNSFRGLLQGNEGVSGSEYDIGKQSEQEHHMLQNRRGSLAGLLRIDGNMSGGIVDDNGMQHHHPRQNKLYDLTGFQHTQGIEPNEVVDDFESFLSR
eukprot:CAMPEP_0172364618 /NCGR_PEP_ID=MMETSP1060-20121228/7694_1 /TAXON_ID=37318 /ORGANISM="Pseudo-nitzschia pungens, Strain cf. cingulata" /LENGTH=663 /DNA_ID=CAMNT_0013087653 /DNA_START=174 /DNA_END=2165 /DNA_ORIENTATION=-